MRENCVNINMNKLIIILYFCFFIALQGYSQSTSNIDAIPPEAVSDLSINTVDTIATPQWTPSFGDCAELTVDNLYKVLDKYNVKFKKIVVAQAILETGHFSSSFACKAITSSDCDTLLTEATTSSTIGKKA